ncbi:MAG TPA: hypothetical protein VJZ16_07445 [Syntrophales bacterium]|nr:hypothetical protein [Syntrophales bacterium]
MTEMGKWWEMGTAPISHHFPISYHLVKEQRHFTILLSPFLNTIKIYDKYADVTPEGVERD